MQSNRSSPSLISLDSQEIQNYKKDKENMWVYIGRPTCEECKRFTPILQEVIKENNETIYYYNTDKAREANEEEMINVLKKLEVKIVPTIIHLKNGEIIKKAGGYQDKSSLEKLLKE